MVGFVDDLAASLVRSAAGSAARALLCLKSLSVDPSKVASLYGIWANIAVKSGIICTASCTWTWYTVKTLLISIASLVDITPRAMSVFYYTSQRLIIMK